MQIAILGAGLAGLACAHELERFGMTPTIYEKQHQVKIPSLLSGIYAARSIMTGENFNTLTQGWNRHYHYSLSIRKYLNRLDNAALDRLVQLVGYREIQVLVFHLQRKMLDKLAFGVNLIPNYAPLEPKDKSNYLPFPLSRSYTVNMRKQFIFNLHLAVIKRAGQSVFSAFLCVLKKMVRRLIAQLNA